MPPSSHSTPLRVGSVPYLVGRPLDLELGLEPGIIVDHDVPARLVERLRAGEIDVAMVSSIELFRCPGYRYLDGIAVAGGGFVGSVQLFLRKSIRDIASVALDPASRTAATLVQVMLADRVGGAPEFREVAPKSDPREAGTDSWLRIGDAALREHHREHLDYFNPSEEWARRTALPFVFAPWIVRPGVDLEPHLDAFSRAYDRGRSRLEALAREAARESRLPESVYLTYLAEECTYELPSEVMRASLLAFRDGAAALGLCDPDLAPEPVELGRSCPG